MSTYADRLAALREQLKADRLDGFVVPLTDEHMSEYVGTYAQRLAWLTGFQGSAGSAVVLPAEAAIFVDGRYTLQVRAQVDGDHWSYQSVPETSIADWLKTHAPAGGRIGYDPWLHTRDWVGKARDALADRGAELVAVRRNPIDVVGDARASRARRCPSRRVCRQVVGQAPEMADFKSQADAVLARFDRLDFQRARPDVDRPVALAHPGPFRRHRRFVRRLRKVGDACQHLGNGVAHSAALVTLADLAGKAVWWTGTVGGGDLRGARRPRKMIARRDPPPAPKLRTARSADSGAGARRHCASHFLHWL